MIHPQPVTAPPAIGGAFLVAARLDGWRSVFAVDPGLGGLTTTEHRLSLSLRSPVCLCFIPDGGEP
jgi:hypothetical protein